MNVRVETLIEELIRDKVTQARFESDRAKFLAEVALDENTRLALLHIDLNALISHIQGVENTDYKANVFGDEGYVANRGMQGPESGASRGMRAPVPVASRGIMSPSIKYKVSR
jgi:hypothetical protein